MTRGKPKSIELVDLRGYLPAMRAGAKALRERERWAERIAFLPTTVSQSAEDAQVLEHLAQWLDRAAPEDSR